MSEKKPLPDYLLGPHNPLLAARALRGDVGWPVAYIWSEPKEKYVSDGIIATPQPQETSDEA